MYDYLPADIRTALDRYCHDLRTGAVKPWDPKHPTSPECPSWLTDWMATHLSILDMDD